MSTIVTRAAKDSPLTFNELDANFTNLNTDKIQSGNTVAALTITNATIPTATIASATITGGSITGLSAAIPIGSGGTGGTTQATARSALGLGTAATTNSDAYATAAQGAKADTALQPDSVVQILEQNLYNPITATGFYTGTALNFTDFKEITLPFRPSLVIIKAATGQYAVFGNETNFMKRTDFFISLPSIAGTYEGIIITDTGFRVGSSLTCNGDGITYYYFAYCDNGSDNLLQGSWAGNGDAGRTVDLFTRKPIAGMICKRDSGRAPVWIVADKVNNYWFNDATGVNSVSLGTSLNGATGQLTVGDGAEINQWEGLLGEGINALAFAKNSDSVFVTTYTGTGAARNVTLPFVPDAFLISTRSTTSPSSRAWFSSLPAGQSLPLTNQAVGTGEFSVSGSRIAFAGSAFNGSGIEYGIYAFRRLNFNQWNEPNIFPIVINKSVELASGGYVDCGTSNTLQISGAITMEWFGTVYLPDSDRYLAATPLSAIDTLAGNQDKLNPLIFRSSGADQTAGAVSFGMCIAAGTVSVDTYYDCSVLVAMHDYWGMLQSGNNVGGSLSLDNHPWNTGITIKANENVHILVTHAGSGYWTLYVNGVRIKERKRDELLATAPAQPRANVTGYSGHKTVIGGRLRDGSIANANGGSVRLARIYNRALTEQEAKNNYLSTSGSATATAGFVEEWDARDASGSTLPAAVNAANNGTIVSGLVI
jgi:hypothetical protein